MNVVAFLVVIGLGGLIYALLSGMGAVIEGKSLEKPAIVVFALSVLALALAASIGTSS
jgi:hypothetical protein